MSLLLLSFILSLSSLPTLYTQTSSEPQQCGPFADTSIPCPAVSDPVCAPYPRYCISTPCPQVMEFYNGCVACQDPTVTTYTLGRCVYTCTTGELNQDKNVVCALYQEGCQDDSCRRQFQNSYTACQDSGVVSYTIEACPVDATEEGEIGASPFLCEEAISIESTAPTGGNGETVLTEETLNEEGEFSDSDMGIVRCLPVSVTESVYCTEQYEPVCAFHDSCVGEDCQGMTVGNSCLACSTYNYDYYVDGACEMGSDTGVVSKLDSDLLVDPAEDWNAE